MHLIDQSRLSSEQGTLRCGPGQEPHLPAVRYDITMMCDSSANLFAGELPATPDVDVSLTTTAVISQSLPALELHQGPVSISRSVQPVGVSFPPSLCPHTFSP